MSACLLGFAATAAARVGRDGVVSAPGNSGPGSGLTDPLLIAVVGEITGMIAAQLRDRANAADQLPAIRSSARGWLERKVRAGLLPAWAGRQLDELVSAVRDQRYGLGPITGFLRDPQVENVDINGYDQVWQDSPTVARLSVHMAARSPFVGRPCNPGGMAAGDWIAGYAAFVATAALLAPVVPFRAAAVIRANITAPTASSPPVAMSACQYGVPGAKREGPSGLPSRSWGYAVNNRPKSCMIT